jgi:hypothetical protein
MIYIIAFLLLVLVLANDKARNMLTVLTASAIGLVVAIGIIGAVLFGLFILGAWLYSIDYSAISFNLSGGAKNILYQAIVIIVGFFLVIGFVVMICDYFRFRKK